MFNEILSILVDEEVSGYPDTENLEDGYTIEGAIKDLLCSLIQSTRKRSTQVFIVELIEALDDGQTSWIDLIEEMEDFEED